MAPVSSSHLDAYLEWGAAARALPGESESGDRYLVSAVPDGVLLAAVDGVGHGSEAALAAKAAIETLERHAREPVDALIKRCHKALQPTRGAVMSLAAFSARDHGLTWIGVGNIAGFLLPANPARVQRTLLLRSGVVGAQLPPLQAATLPVDAGDMLIFITDGVGGDFLSSTGSFIGFSLEPSVVASMRQADRYAILASTRRDDSLQTIADRILARYGKDTDDALVLAVRFR
jgi:negative regulator of sigma-B (phosphoserine phosphatase)